MRYTLYYPLHVIQTEPVSASGQPVVLGTRSVRVVNTIQASSLRPARRVIIHPATRHNYLPRQPNRKYNNLSPGIRTLSGRRPPSPWIRYRRVGQALSLPWACDRPTLARCLNSQTLFFFSLHRIRVFECISSLGVVVPPFLVTD